MRALILCATCASLQHNTALVFFSLKCWCDLIEQEQINGSGPLSVSARQRLLILLCTLENGHKFSIFWSWKHFLRPDTRKYFSFLQCVSTVLTENQLLAQDHTENQYCWGKKHPISFISSPILTPVLPLSSSLLQLISVYVWCSVSQWRTMLRSEKLLALCAIHHAKSFPLT